MVHGIYMYMYYMHEYIFLIVQYLLSKAGTIIIHFKVLMISTSNDYLSPQFNAIVNASLKYCYCLLFVYSSLTSVTLSYTNPVDNVCSLFITAGLDL